MDQNSEVCETKPILKAILAIVTRNLFHVRYSDSRSEPTKGINWQNIPSLQQSKILFDSSQLQDPLVHTQTRIQLDQPRSFLKACPFFYKCTRSLLDRKDGRRALARFYLHSLFFFSFFFFRLLNTHSFSLRERTRRSGRAENDCATWIASSGQGPSCTRALFAIACRGRVKH